MVKRVFRIAVVLALTMACIASAQYPILDMIAGQVVTRYEGATCEQLWENRGKPKTADQQQFIQMLRGDAQMRTVFINRIAAPVANKMFECGLIP